MPINYVNSIKVDRMEVVMRAIDAAAPNPGRLILVVREGTTYLDAVIIPFAIPSFQNDGNGEITMLGGSRTENAIRTGTIERARIEDGAGNLIGDGLRVDTTAASSPDVLVSSIYVMAGNAVTIFSGRITHG